MKEDDWEKKKEKKKKKKDRWGHLYKRGSRMHCENAGICLVEKGGRLEKGFLPINEGGLRDGQKDDTKLGRIKL